VRDRHQRVLVGEPLEEPDPALGFVELAAQLLHFVHEREECLAHARRQLRLGNAGERDDLARIRRGRRAPAGGGPPRRLCRSRRRRAADRLGVADLH
jgi:hypothetical protein